MLRPLLAFLMAFRIGLTTPQKQPKDCQFPSTWEGTWYHSGFPHPLNISAKHISSKGTCVQQSGSMFIMVDRYVIFLIRWTFISSITSSCRLYISNAQRVFFYNNQMATLIYGTRNVDDTFTEDERVPKRAQKCGGDSTPPLLKIAKVCILQKCHVRDYQLFCQTKENKPPF